MRKRNALVVALLALALLIVLLFPAGAASSKDQVFEELQRQGLNTAAACGVMANIDKESTFNPSVSSRDGSYGLCQWTGSRKSNLFSYCDQNGLDSSSVEGQIAFLMYELQTGYKGVYNTLLTTSNTADGAYNAAYRFCYDFERPANKAGRSTERANLAKNSYWPAYRNAVALNGLVQGSDGRWAVYEDGSVDTSVTGVVQNQHGWWRVENGYVNFGANGIYHNANGWWKTTNGKVLFNENGVYQNEHGWWKTTNSKVTFKETGVFQNENGWWYCVNSKVDFSYNGTVEYNGVKYKVVDGRAGAIPDVTKAAEASASAAAANANAGK